MKNLQLLLSILYILAILVIAGIFTGCSTVQQELDPKVYYQNTLEVEVNGTKYQGWGVIPKAKEYKVRIKRNRGKKLSFFKVSSCHREFSSYDEGSRWEGRFEIQEGIEDTGSCLWRVEAFDKKGKHEFGLFDIQTESEELIGVLKCNGEIYANTVTMCESRQDLVQSIHFDRSVKMASNIEARCKLDAPTKFKSLKFKLRNRECVYAFISDEGKLHRLTTVGYESILIGE